ncbi:MAG: amidophosphoribosyltransferase, partial [Candidatus Thorarchaeota archaeon]|nr:amidophosphoribosyltransferase [Candidatus Thorarchaeota archaeon]
GLEIMCGVMGILGNYSIVSSRDLLQLLTHRGQDAAGILWSSENEYESRKSMGSPATIQLPNERSNLIIGSTRYPTSGRRVASEADLKTFVGPFNTGGLALTHNGNIINMAKVCDKTYDCDSEFLTDRIALHLSSNDDNIVKAFKCLDQEVDGAYSLIGIHKGRLFAYRDPRGFKPLVFGRKNDLTVIASESTVIEMAGLELERDVYPGELVLFGPGPSMESHSISQSEAHSHCFFEYVYFAHPAATMENNLIYDTRFRLGRALARTLKKMNLETPDYVVPVPDTSRPAAQALAEELNVPMREIILKNRYLGRTFIARSPDERDRMAKSKYIYLDGKIKGRNIVVVDDSIVRGTTGKRIVEHLKEKGANKVYFAVTCPPQVNACYYGIDIATDKELIASDTSIEGIKEYIQADALIYQEMEGLENAIGLKDLCLACLDGKYPTEHARKIRKSLEENSGSCEGRDYERSLE